MDLNLPPVSDTHLKKRRGFLPSITQARTRVTHQKSTQSDTDSHSSTTNVDQMRRASKRAINMLMRNMKNKQTSVWVPSGRQMK